MIKWDKRLMALAELVSSWSKDPSSQVGAVIVDAQNRIISLGYNGFARGVNDNPEILADRDEKLRRTIHAEENALLFAKRSVDGCTIYINRPPCGPCTAKLIQAGIWRIVFKAPDAAFSERWRKDYDAAMSMIAQAGLEVLEV